MANYDCYRNGMKEEGRLADRSGFPQEPIAIDRAEFVASLHSTATRALLTDARQLLHSGQFPPQDPGDFGR